MQGRSKCGSLQQQCFPSAPHAYACAEKFNPSLCCMYGSSSIMRLSKFASIERLHSLPRLGAGDDRVLLDTTESHVTRRDLACFIAVTRRCPLLVGQNLKLPDLLDLDPAPSTNHLPLSGACSDPWCLGGWRILRQIRFDARVKLEKKELLSP